MKRRQFGAALASTAFALTGVTAGTSAVLAREDDARQIQTQNVSTTVGGVTLAANSATMTHEGSTMTAQVDGATMETATRSGSIAQLTVTVDEISAETFQTLRDGVVEAASAQSPLALFTAFESANVSPDAPVTISVESVSIDGRGTLFDSATATGTVGSIAPSNAASVAAGGSPADLEPMEFAEITASSGDSTLTARGAVVSFGETTATIQMPEGEVTTPTRSLAFADAETVLLPPASVPQEQMDAFASLRAQVQDGSLTLRSARDTFAEFGVTASDVFSSLLSVRFEAQIGDITEDGASVAQNIGTSGTLGELLQITGGAAQVEETEAAEEGALTQLAIVSAPNTDEFVQYAFEVTGNLEYLEPDEDSPPDEVIDAGDRVRAEGGISTGDDRYAFSGDLVETDVPEEVEIEIRER